MSVRNVDPGGGDFHEFAVSWTVRKLLAYQRIDALAYPQLHSGVLVWATHTIVLSTAQHFHC